MELAAKYVAVALLAASPVGDLLVAIPVGLGLGLGLSPLPVAIVAVSANLLPALALDRILLLVARRDPWVARLVRWLARPRAQRLLGRYGLPGVLLATPWLGVYAAAVTPLAALGFGLLRG